MLKIETLFQLFVVYLYGHTKKKNHDTLLYNLCLLHRSVQNLIILYCMKYNNNYIIVISSYLLLEKYIDINSYSL